MHSIYIFWPHVRSCKCSGLLFDVDAHVDAGVDVDVNVDFGLWGRSRGEGDRQCSPRPCLLNADTAEARSLEEA